MTWRTSPRRVRRRHKGRNRTAAIPPLPPELSTKEQELRRLVDAGAASPEELPSAAAKLEEQRTYEESLWRREVRPALMQSKKRRFSLVDLRRDGVEERPQRPRARRSLLLVGVLVLLLIATQTSFLMAARRRGRRARVRVGAGPCRPPTTAERPPPPPPDTTD